MRKRWTVIYTQCSMYDGMGTGEEPYERGRTEHWTYIGADFYRRFREQVPSLGMRWVETAIVHDGEPIEKQPPRRTRLYERITAPAWSVLYFLRSRWDGLRWGFDRDRRP